MRFLSASALWWLLLCAPIIFFYLFKLKRKRRIVPSVLLWSRTVEELEANAPFRRLRRNLLLLLQLLALIALVFTLARPLVTTRALASGSTVIVIDSTASMRSRDEDGGSRLDRSKQLAHDMVEGLGGSDRAAIIESSARVTVLCPLTSDRSALAKAIDEVTETDAAGTLSDAVLLAQQIAKSEQGSGIVVISDGCMPASGEGVGNSSAVRDANIRFVRVGQRAANAGIVALNSRAVEGGTRQELFAAIANFGDAGREIGVELRVNGKLIDARSTRLGANDRGTLIYDTLPREGGLAELRIDAEDDLISDNVAYAHLPDARRLRVGVASDNPFVLQALAVNPDIDARRIGAGEDLGGFDCVVGEGADRPVPQGDVPALTINPSGSNEWRITGTEQNPEVSVVDRNHPVNAYLSYSDLHVESTSKRETAPWLKPIVSAENCGLVWAGDDGRRRVVMIGFDLAQSDLPLKVEFPILLANSISWLTGREGTTSERVLKTGKPIDLHQESGAIVVNTPDGRSEELTTAAGEAAFAGTLLTGVYTIEGGAPFAATLLSEAESDTLPRDSISTREGTVTGEARSFSSEREAWKWIALAVLALLALEWWAYHRRISA